MPTNPECTFAQTQTAAIKEAPSSPDSSEAVTPTQVLKAFKNAKQTIKN